MKPLQERYTEALLARGKIKIGQSGKYQKFTCRVSDNSRTVFYYVGKSGALRIGHNLASSAPVSDGFKKQLLEGVNFWKGEKKS